MRPWISCGERRAARFAQDRRSFSDVRLPAAAFVRDDLRLPARRLEVGHLSAAAESRSPRRGRQLAPIRIR
jgi:hypothetical protein